MKKELFFEFSFLGKKLTVEFKTLAFQADVSLLVSYDKSSVLTTLVYEKNQNQEASFLPLNVTFLERMYAFGEIPGGFFKREVKNSEFSVLLARLTDRLLRPLFPKCFFRSIQITNVAFSAERDKEGDLKFCSLLGSILAATVSDLPLKKRSFSAFILDKDNFLSVVRSPLSDFKIETDSYFEIVLGLDSSNKVLMLEAVCPEIKRNAFLFLLEKMKTVISELLSFQEKIVREVGFFYQKKPELTSFFSEFENFQTLIKDCFSPDFFSQIENEVSGEISKILENKSKKEREEELENFQRDYFVKNIEGEKDLLVSE